MSAETPSPTVRLVRGSADADEIAALLAVLHAVAACRAAAPSLPPVPVRAAWTRPARHPVAGTWRARPPAPPSAW
ncbi:acyl-CoA carboxylase subunit epsilon [Streptomyces sp. LP11]|uniref:Acyl-CoA carboxylase subunit epsilon n=1 Tax=Streptomyces pyxinicus TaxID=2970331 RepID=A0ABT2BCN2_9ACTN|nr:acyl-CoA carboxylase epsilon subunit [Streptomyces sp. LP11]MCS0606283.1 acyl-CoA carboxylase subunit epsilon [Streptomyces sp. LP11]